MDQNGHDVERRLVDLETALAHHIKVNDELSDIVACVSAFILTIRHSRSSACRE